MVRAVRPFRSLSMARGCARIDSRLDTVKISLAGRVEVHHARFLAVIGVRKTFPHGLGRKRKAITSRVAALKNVLAALLSSDASKFNDADRRFVRAMIALGAPNNVTASAFGISEVELLAKFRDELQSRPRDTARPD